MTRTHILLLAAATALLPAVAEAIPRQGSRGGSVRACSTCASRDSLRQRREFLLLRLDTLRSTLDNRRLSAEEREQISQQITNTVLLIGESMDESMRVGQNYEPRRDAIVRVAPSVAVATAFRTRGYLGVTFDGPSMDQNSSGERVIRFLQYPRIALVDAGSPAERGGVIQGDTLLAFNGTDVRDNEISLTRLLVPDTKIVMRVRRDGGSRDLKVTVGETPGYYTWRGVPAPAVAAVPPMPVAPDGRPSRVKTTGEVIVVPAPSVWRYEEGFGGAQVATISDGLGKALGVNEGVLVIHALPGTPAYRSGLRDGDIIQSVAGRSVVSVRGLQRILAESDGAVGVKLTVLKERKQTEITLRW